MNLIERRIQEQHSPWRGEDVVGTPVTVHGSPTEGEVNGRKVVLAGTNNYLGLTYHPECIAAAQNAAKESGTGTTGSRMANGTYPEHAALEAELAAFYEARSAIVFTTGYQANVGIISAIGDRDSVLMLDAQSHASIYDGAKLSDAQTYRFKHNDAADLDKKLNRLGEKAAQTLVILEGIYSMLGDSAPLKDLVEASKAHGAAVLIDEAHSFGVLGETGRGLAEQVGIEDQIDVVTGTFSKSLGCVGGYAVSRMHDLDVLRVASRAYLFSASPAPSVIASARAALAIIRRDPSLREQLMDNARRVYLGLHQLGYQLGPEISPVVGVVLQEPDTTLNAWRFLLDNGVYVNPVAPPASPGPYCLLRVSLSAAHTAEQVDTIVEGFRKLKEAGVVEIPPAGAIS
jgi:8-amino-7-oxononanoate synthase